MPHTRTRLLLVATTLVSGILAGTIADRVIVGGPAWHELGVEAWVQYSRHADLGTGLAAYSIEGVGAALLMIASAVSNRLDRNGWRGAAIPLLVGVAFSAIGLVLTVKAAPIMLGLEKPLPADAQERAFNEFFFWGLYLRGAADAGSFLAAVWALASLGDRDA